MADGGLWQGGRSAGSEAMLGALDQVADVGVMPHDDQGGAGGTEGGDGEVLLVPRLADPEEPQDEKQRRGEHGGDRDVTGDGEDDSPGDKDNGSDGWNKDGDDPGPGGNSLAAAKAEINRQEMSQERSDAGGGGERFRVQRGVGRRRDETRQPHRQRTFSEVEREHQHSPGQA